MISPDMVPVNIMTQMTTNGPTHWHMFLGLCNSLFCYSMGHAPTNTK